MRKIHRLVLCVTCLVVGFTVAAAADSVELLGRDYVRTDSGWVQRDLDGDHVVDTTTVSVRFRDGIADLDAFRQALADAGGDAELGRLRRRHRRVGNAPGEVLQELLPRGSAVGRDRG